MLSETLAVIRRRSGNSLPIFIDRRLILRLVLMTCMLLSLQRAWVGWAGSPLYLRLRFPGGQFVGQTGSDSDGELFVLLGVPMANLADVVGIRAKGERGMKKPAPVRYFVDLTDDLALLAGSL